MSNMDDTGESHQSLCVKHRSVEELEAQSDTPLEGNKTTEDLLPTTSAKKPKKSKVKRIASMFNCKFSKMIKRGEAEQVKYNALVNDRSPGTKPVSKAKVENGQHLKPAVCSSPPKPRPKAIYVKAESTVPSARYKHFLKQATTSSPACFVAADAFAELSVKDKAKFYNQFIQEMCKKNPRFKEIKKEFPFDEQKKQTTVKSILEELEFNTVFPIQKKPDKNALKRLDSMKKVCAERKTSSTSRTSTDLACKAKESNNGNKSNDAVMQTSSGSSSSDTMFGSEQMDELFFSWFKEKHGPGSANNSENLTSDMDEEKQKSAIDRLLEDAIARLESLEKEKHTTGDNPQPSSSGFCSQKCEAEESAASMIKHSCEAQTEIQNKPIKPLRKQKSPKKDTSNHHTAEQEQQVKQNLQEATNMVKAIAAEEDFEGLDKALLKEINSPSRVKSAYTLTINDLETPINTPRTSINFVKPELRYMGSQRRLSFPKPNMMVSTPLKTSTARQELFSLAPPAAAPAPLTSLNSNKMMKTDSRRESAAPSSRNSSVCNFILPGPPPTLKMPACTPNDPALNYWPSLRRESIQSPRNSMNNNFVSSTPIKGQSGYQFCNTAIAGLQSFSPIGRASTGSRCESIDSYYTARQQSLLYSPSIKAHKARRRSFYDMDLSRSSFGMEVIREDQPFEPISQVKPTKANAPRESSQFWIKCDDLTIALDINYLDHEKLRLLYKIFGQTSCETKDLHFGIDNYKFSLHQPVQIVNNLATQSKTFSHYWFSTGDLTMPFSGKHISPAKIQRLFDFINEDIEETVDIRFGVDHVEFSKVSEFWDQSSPKYSVSSQYSVLVGLQAGLNDGLEDDNKYAWPRSNPVAMSDQSDIDQQLNFEEIDGNRLSFSAFPFNNQYDFSSSLAHKEFATSRDSQHVLNFDFESEPLEQLFVDNLVPQINNKLDPPPYKPPPPPYKPPPPPHTVPYPSALLKMDFKSEPLEQPFQDNLVPETNNKLDPTISPPDTVLPPLSSLNLDFESNPFEQLFEDNLVPETNNKLDPTISPPDTVLPLPDAVPPPPPSSSSADNLISSMQTGKQHLNTTKEYLSNLKFSHLTKENLEALQGTPQYTEELKNIASNISQIACKSDFKNCTAEELERYTFFLCRYAEVCVNSCTKHVNTVLDALEDYKSVAV